MTQPLNDLLREKVRHYYWDLDLNCAVTTLKILSETFSIPLNPQIEDAAVGMHGAGRFGAQCGLVEGALMFIGIAGRAISIPDEEIISCCRQYATQFEARFGSLICRQLRPQGFKADNPPHLCLPLTQKAVIFSMEFLSKRLNSPVL